MFPWRKLVFTTYDATVAEAAGMPVRFLEYMLPFLVALTTVAAIKTVGNVMVMSMLAVPSVTRTLLARRLSTIMVASVVASVALLLWVLIISPRRGFLTAWLKRKSSDETVMDV